MNIELLIARTWIVLCAILAVLLLVAAGTILHHGVRRWVKGQDKDINSNVWIAMLVSFTLLFLLCAIMDVGQAFPMLDKADEIAWLIGPLLGILVTGKTFVKVSSNKYGTQESTIPAPPDSKNGGG